MGDFHLGRAGKPRRAAGRGSSKIGIRDVGENESAREGYPPGAILQ